MESEAELGPDGDLVSAMISTAVIPRICKILEKGGLDPYSAKDVRRLIDLCEEIEVSVPKEHLKFEVRFEKSLNLCLIIMSTSFSCFSNPRLSHFRRLSLRAKLR